MATGYEQLDEKKTNPFPVPGGYILTTIVSSTKKSIYFQFFGGQTLICMKILSNKTSNPPVNTLT